MRRERFRWRATLSSAGVSFPRSSMKSSPPRSTGASAAGAEGNSPALPATPWAELDPGEERAERLDALGHRRLEDSSDEEDRGRRENNRALDDENTEVTHDTALHRRSCAALHSVYTTADTQNTRCFLDAPGKERFLDRRSVTFQTWHDGRRRCC